MSDPLPKETLNELATEAIKNSMKDGTLDFDHLKREVGQAAAKIAGGRVDGVDIFHLESNSVPEAARAEVEARVNERIAQDAKNIRQEIFGAINHKLGLEGVRAIENANPIEVGEGMEGISCHNVGTQTICQSEGRSSP